MTAATATIATATATATATIEGATTPAPKGKAKAKAPKAPKAKAKAKVPTAYMATYVDILCTWERLLVSGIALACIDNQLCLLVDDENYDCKGVLQSVGSQLADKGYPSHFIGAFKSLVSACGAGRRSVDEKVDIPNSRRQRSIGTKHVASISFFAKCEAGRPANIVDLGILVECFDNAIDKRCKKTKRSVKRGKALVAGAKARHAYRKAGGTDEAFDAGTTRHANDKRNREAQVKSIQAGAAF